VLAGTVAATAATAEAQGQSMSYQFDIPSRDLSAALQQVAVTSHRKLLYRADLVTGRTSRPIKGSFTAEQAIGEILSGTDLTFEVTAASVVVIRGKTAANTAPPVNTDEGGAEDIRMAQSDTSDNPVNNSAEKDRGKGEGVEEIIVTAQRREQRTQDIPFS